MGGKYLLKNDIVKLFPKNYQNMIYVEPFVGGGSIFYKKEPSVKEVINDIDKNLITVYKGFKKYDYEKIKNDVDGIYNKEKFKKIKESNPKAEYDKFIRLFLLFRLSFYAQLKSYGGRKHIKLIVDYGKRLKDVEIYNKSYQEIIKKYDSNNTFFYLDPPYEDSDDRHYDNFDIDYNQLKDILSNIKGKFLLSINKSKYINDLFKGFNIRTLKTKYSDAFKGGQNKVKEEYIISNY